jgi:hypothetical protein
MTAHVDLEVGLYHLGPGSYSVELRLSHEHESEADRRWSRPIRLNLDVDALRSASMDLEEYGRLLGKSLFESSDMREALAHARTVAQEHEVPLRLRLFIDHDAMELHGLRWELLRDPADGSFLFLDERLLFSRYLSSWDWHPVRARVQSDLRALVVIANPGDLGSWKPEGRGLAPVDVAGELERARGSMSQLLHVETLASGGKATLDSLILHLREGYDILYLVCHGALAKGEPYLWLEDAAGQTACVAGGELIQRLKELKTRPRLVVLASCQSAGTGEDTRTDDGGVLSALGPRLAEIGIPAVLAMQGNISMKTVERFMPAFFTELQRDGQIDRAMTAARGAVRERPDWWMPVLFMRLKSGRIWYMPGFGGDPKGFQKWPALLNNIRRGVCTPILGPGLTESLLGSWRDIAQSWAERYHFPMAPAECEDLAQVAQFLVINQDRGFPIGELDRHIREETLRRYRDTLPVTEKDLQNLGLDALLSQVGARRRQSTPTEPHRVLAQLPCPLYVTTNYDGLLVDALREAGKAPRVEFCRWKSELETTPLLKELEPSYTPDANNPLVYYLFGRYSIPESMVITQDDYLDFLIGYSRNRDIIPAFVRQRLTNSALLFVGFQLDAVGFRVLFRSIISQEGSSKLSRLAHVAAQVDPEEGRILEPEGARKYLESYFMENAKLSIFWGDADDFLKELSRHWSAPS